MTPARAPPPPPAQAQSWLTLKRQRARRQWPPGRAEDQGDAAAELGKGTAPGTRHRGRKARGELLRTGQGPPAR
jgi:hypothetical protein